MVEMPDAQTYMYVPVIHHEKENIAGTGVERHIWEDDC